MTGQQFYRLEEGANLHSTLDTQFPNFMFMLRDAGYQIAHYRKAWGPGDYKAGGYRESPVGPNSSLEAFMKERDKTRPFCFWFGTSDPHRPYVKGSGAESGIAVDQVHVPAFYPDKGEIRSDIADYYFEVQRWDGDVGEALKLLEVEGELENTLVVMSGDHGMPFPRCKGNLYDWGAHVPLAIRWGAEVEAGRHVTDFTSFTDFAPTFLEAAGLKVPEEMTGRSLMPILKTKKSGRVDEKRDFMVFGRERHVPAQEMPSMVGYPSRALRTDEWLLIMNLEPERWPAGVPEGASHPIGQHADCDAGPTKSFLIENKSGKYSKYYELCFWKRPSVELYNCVDDPEQVKNLATDEQYAGTLKKLRKQLIHYLEGTNDPRFTVEEVKFDQVPYRAKYMKSHLEKHGY